MFYKFNESVNYYFYYISYKGAIRTVRRKKGSNNRENMIDTTKLYNRDDVVGLPAGYLLEFSLLESLRYRILY